MGDCPKMLYTGTMNDALFIIDGPPRPAPVDAVGTGTHANVIATMTNNDRAAEMICKKMVAAYNKAESELTKLSTSLASIEEHVDHSEAQTRAALKRLGDIVQHWKNALPRRSPWISPEKFFQDALSDLGQQINAALATPSAALAKALADLEAGK